MITSKALCQINKMASLDDASFTHQIAGEDRREKVERPVDDEKIYDDAQCTGVRLSMRTNARFSTRRSMTKSAKAHNHKAW